MKENISILIIDDVKQDSQIKVLKHRLNTICTPHIVQIYTRDTDLRKNDDSDDLDIEKLKSKLKEKLKGPHIDWIATDFNLGETNLDGIDVIRLMQKIRPFRRKNIILYSGNIQRAVKKILDESATEDKEDTIISAVTDFINLPILKFEGRSGYIEAIVDIVSKNSLPSMEDRLIKQLYRHKDMTFNSCYPPFAGKTFGEIADILDADSDARSIEWKEALLEQLIAYLTNVNS